MELARLSTSIRFQNRANVGKGKELHKGDTAQKKHMPGGGGHHIYFLIWGTIGVEKKHTGRGDATHT